MNPMHPHLFTRVGKDATLVKLAIRDLDEPAIHSVKEQLTDLAGGIGPIELRLDFERIESMGSSALAMLVSINRKVAKNDGHVIVFNVADHLVKLFQLTRLDTILDIRSRRGDGRNPTRASA
jgi:anti-anti-sigma factor